MVKRSLDNHYWWCNVMGLEGPRPTTRLVLSAAYICFYDKDDNGVARPVTLARLSEASGLNRDTVVRHLKKAIQDGWLGEITGSRDRHLYPSYPPQIRKLAEEGERMLASMSDQTPDERSRLSIQLH